ncbi:MAG: hypothetical protein KAT48_13790, partial [Bacteroidales bacterium]|nr:hypothetical protein [Bacteroidales bacterium]
MALFRTAIQIRLVLFLFSAFLAHETAAQIIYSDFHADIEVFPKGDNCLFENYLGDVNSDGVNEYELVSTCSYVS